jgi:hypothetical protein
MKLRCFRAVFLSQLLTVTAAFATATVKFANPTVYGSAGSGTNFVVVADLNGDGFPDMIVANTDGVSVRLNNGDGTFGAAMTYGTGGENAFAVAVGDVNGDGIPDLVVTNNCLSSPGCSNGAVGVLLGNGDGTFQSAVSYNAGGINTRAIVIGDVNNDGWPDLIVTSNCQAHTCVDGSIRLLLNNGNGTFTLTPIAISPSMGGPLAIGDLNGDGNLDLVAGVGVLLGNGDGTFNPPGSIPGMGVSYVPGETISIALADVNNDGNLDVVVADQVSVKVQMGYGDGTLQQPVSYKSGGFRPLSVALADFNGDGNTDVAVANECSSLTNNVCASTGSLGVLAGNGDGTFQAPVKYLSGGYLATSVAVGDANGDSKPDIFVSNTCAGTTTCTNGTIGVFLNTFKAAVTVQVMSSLNPALVNQPFNLTATLTAPVPVPDGSTVSFFSGSTLLGSGSTTGGVASLTSISFRGYGAHIITAKYPGDTYHNSGSGTVTEIVQRYSTSTTIMSSLNSSTAGQKVTFTATVTSSGPSAPTGSVQFFKNGVFAGAATVSNLGTAKLSITLQTGTYNMKAKYLGDGQSDPSTSATLQQAVN